MLIYIKLLLFLSKTLYKAFKIKITQKNDQAKLVVYLIIHKSHQNGHSHKFQDELLP